MYRGFGLHVDENAPIKVYGQTRTDTHCTRHGRSWSKAYGYRVDMKRAIAIFKPSEFPVETWTNPAQFKQWCENNLPNVSGILFFFAGLDVPTRSKAQAANTACILLARETRQTALLTEETAAARNLEQTKTKKILRLGLPAKNRDGRRQGLQVVSIQSSALGETALLEATVLCLVANQVEQETGFLAWVAG